MFSKDNIESVTNTFQILKLLNIFENNILQKLVLVFRTKNQLSSLIFISKFRAKNQLSSQVFTSKFQTTAHQYHRISPKVTFTN